MNISYNWLKQYIDFNLTPEELSAALTSVGLETGGIEQVESIPGGLKGIVIGKVLTCVEHPNSDHLHITTVDLGDGQPTQIVCGAPNVAAGQTVVVATVGTTLYDGDQSFQIKKSKIRGVESFGMICAEDEINIGKSHDGIIVLPDGAAKPGTPAAEYYNMHDDFVLEVDLTPNRIDAASHYGVARDVAAWLACHDKPTTLKRPDVSAFKIDNPAVKGITVDVKNPEACTRYAGVTIKGVTVKESPEWLKDCLNAIGMHPINNIVDITNYILHSFCQPLHCFDLAKIKGGRIEVKTCADGTKFTTLDGVERSLNSADLMICNAEEPMCIAGVFGGLDSGVTEATTDVFLESACFNATSVRRTARRHGLSTDSSFRFERGVDPNGCIYALKVAALLVKELAGGEIVGETVDIYPNVVAPYPVKLSYNDINKLIGSEIPQDKVDTILKALEIEVTDRDAATGEMSLNVPTYRVDVQRPCDVIEDVLRIYGYNNIPMSTTLHSSLSFKTTTDEVDDLRHTISDQLTGAGFNEILNNSLTAEAYYADLKEYSAEGCVRVINPLSQDLNVMRRTLLFGGLESLEHNINRKAADLAFYEFGNVYNFNPAVQGTAEKPLAPYSEGQRLALWMTGNLRQGNWARPAESATVYDLRATVANIFARLGIEQGFIALTPASTELLSSALLIATKSGKQLGSLGIVRSDIAKRCGVKAQVLFCELDWNELTKLAIKRKVTYAPLPKTQAVKRDLSLLIDSTVTMADIEKVVRDSERKLLRSVTLFDVYEGDKLPAGKKSYAISMTLRDDEKTLQDKYIDQIMSRIIANLTSKLGAELR
jgi:phenylalanyl-tRNA synthetase beta chain